MNPPVLPPLALDNHLWMNNQDRSIADLLEIARMRFGTDPSSNTAVAFAAGNQESAIIAALWLASSGSSGMIVSEARLTPQVVAETVADGMKIVSAESGAVLHLTEVAVHESGIRILTSGSTGAPKRVLHSWKSLYTAAAVRHTRSLRWLLTYQPGTYAWFQMVAPFLFQPGWRLAVAAEQTVPVMIETAAKAAVTAISSTPTFWRLALMLCEASVLPTIPLKQISLGGEPVDQEILDTLSRVFPESAVTHIFASTESGPAFIVSDKRAGFPSSWIDDQTDGRGIRVIDGRLQVRTRWTAPSMPEWVETGDRVEIRGDRAFVVGRDGRTDINVGGLKVSAFDVEAVIRGCPDVLWCRVFAVKAPLVGNLVGAEIVGRSGTTSPADLENRVVRHCSERLAEHMVPRVVRVLDSIAVSQALKSEVAIAD